MKGNHVEVTKLVRLDRPGLGTAGPVIAARVSEDQNETNLAAADFGAGVLRTQHLAEHVDVLIVGAGISGVSAAWHLQDRCPDKSYAILEARPDMGGTWNLFRYPGVRSDSDMYTLGFRFRPWSSAKAIVDGPSILTYVRETAVKSGIDTHIRYRHKMIGADWSDAEDRWRVHIDHKDVVVIGSGTIALTLVPALAASGAGHVTMLQRSPTYIVSLPDEDGIAAQLNRWLTPHAADTVTRWKNVVLQSALYRTCQRLPRQMRRLLMAAIKHQLPEGFDVEKHFGPRYNPWDQRLRVAPNTALRPAVTTRRRTTLHRGFDDVSRKWSPPRPREFLPADHPTHIPPISN